MRNGARNHAVVVGASMAGLGTARALSSHFERVTVVERDELPDGVDVRKGVPQAEHAHGLLASGYRVLDEYFPKLFDELTDAGALRGDVTGDFLWYQYGRWKLRADCGLGGIVVSRPLLETSVRRRVRALENVTILDGHDADAPIFDSKQDRVTGLRVKNRATSESTTLDADLLIDASGRGSPAPKWLASWGFGDVVEEVVKVDVGYATATFERRKGDLFGSIGAIVAGTPPGSKRYAAILGAEDSRWVITLVGTLRDYPPTEVAPWKEFARTLPIPDIHEMVKDREPLLPIASFRFPANRRRRYSRLPRFPKGFLVMGDAVCSFNPLYGQGMSVSLCEARALDTVLSKGDDALAARFFAEVDSLVEAPWAITTGEDLKYPEVEGARPPGFRILSRYLERTHRAAARDPVVLRRFFEVGNLLAPPTALLSPAIAWRVLLGGRGTDQASPAQKRSSN